MAIRVEWRGRLEDIEALEGPWRALEEAVVRRSVISRFDHLWPWYRHYGSRLGEPLLGVAWEGSELVGLAPLIRRRDRLGHVPVRKVDFAAYDAESGEFLVADDRPDVIGDLLRSLRATVLFDVVSLKNMEAASPQVRAVEEAAARTGLAVERGESVCALVDLGEGYEAYSKATGHRLRKDLKKRANKVAAAGGVSLDGAHFVTDPARVADCIERTFDINDGSWKARQRGPLASHHREFYRELCERFARRGMADVSILKIGDTDAAYLIGLAERGVYYDVTISYHDHFSGLAPGFYLMEQVLRILPSFGIRTVVSHGAHEYKRRWATEFSPLTRLYLFPAGVRATLSRLLKFRVAPALGRTEPLFD